MPGVVGFTCGKLPPVATRAALGRMRGLLSHGESQHLDELFCDGRVCATRSHTDLVQRRPQPHTENGIHVWLDGEFYNREELGRVAGAQLEDDPALLLALYREHGDLDFLKEVDGIYAAAIYDACARRMHLMSDRYGLRHLSWTTYEGGIAWASEAKAMLALPGFEPKIDREALRDFFEVGHLRGDCTWFEGVRLLQAATVLTWDLDGRSAHRLRYWGADEIKPLANGTDAVELAEELGRLFRAAVERRSRPGERTGLTLSGGLDSRAILAAMPNHEGPIHAVTFGKKGCEDARIAAAATAAKGASHHALVMNVEEWLPPRLEAVWWTDGELDLMHMHVITILPWVRELFDIGLDGLGANGIIGDSWMDQGMAGPPEYIDSRTRRFLVLGPTSVRGSIEERFPFFDNRFVELALGAPDTLKKGNALYRMMLLKTFPAFFENIPWQKTGAPITWPHPKEARGGRLAGVKETLRGKLSWYGLAAPPSRGYADYADWIRKEPARSIFRDALLSRSALYPAYVPRAGVEGHLAKHFDGKDRAEILCRFLTFEIWLRRVFEGTHVPAPEARGDYIAAG